MKPNRKLFISQSGTISKKTFNGLSKRVCEYKDISDGFYRTSCKHDLFAGEMVDLKDLGFKYCPYCANPIKVKEGK